MNSPPPPITMNAQVPSWDCTITVKVKVTAPSKEIAMLFLENAISLSLSVTKGNAQIGMSVEESSPILIATGMGQSSKPS